MPSIYQHCARPRRAVLFLALMTAATAWLGASSGAVMSPQSSLPSDGEIRAWLTDRIDVQHKSLGMIAGTISPGGRRLVAWGRWAANDTRAIDGDTVFEVGSVTKIFTTLVLADMVRRGEVALSDPVVKYLPANVHVPQRNGQAITLLDLATQASGLPFFPTDVPLADPVKATELIAAYSVDHLYQWLGTFTLPRDIGSQWEYSNVGVALLGHALAHRAGVPYEQLIATRITGPLHMTSTALRLPAGRIIPGHDADLRPAPAVNMPAFEPAGSLLSTTNDLLVLLSACLGDGPPPIVEDVRLMLATERRGGGFFQQAIGWWIVPMGAGDPGFAFHGGQTPGYSSAMAFDARLQLGVVVLSNSTNDSGDIAWHLMRPTFPLVTSDALKARTAKAVSEVQVPAAVLDHYVGRYQPTTGGAFTIARRGAGIVLISDDTPAEVTLHATSDREFFMTGSDVKVSFEPGSDGQAQAVVFHFAGTDTRATRIVKGWRAVPGV